MVINGIDSETGLPAPMRRWCIVWTASEIAVCDFIDQEVKDSAVFQRILIEFDCGDEYSVVFTNKEETAKHYKLMLDEKYVQYIVAPDPA